MDAEKQKTGIIYCRVSSKDQVDGTSLGSQERICKDYAQRNGIRILEIYVEKGESAKTADRTQFTKAINFCMSKKKLVDYFIVYKVDRFSRKNFDYAIIVSKLRLCGTELRSATEPINETAFGKWMAGMLSVSAEFDNDVRTERTRNGMLERIKQGIWILRAPIGYYRPSPGSNITPQADVATYIRLAFEEYAKGTHSYQSLATFLKDRGMKTAENKMPCAQLIEKIIKNPLYCGIMEVKGDRYEGSFEPIISRELFEQCQEGYKRRASKSVPHSALNPDFPLRREVVCIFCSQPLTGSFSRGRRGKRYGYYHHHKQNCEMAKSIRKEKLEGIFVEYLKNISPNAKYEKAFKEIVVRTWKENYQKFSEVNMKVRKEIDNLEGERLKIFELHRAQKYTDDEFLEQKNLITERINQKNTLLRENQIEEFKMDEALAFFFEFARDTAKTWSELEYPDRLRFQKKIFEGKLTFDGEKFGTPKLTPIYKLNGEYDGKKSHLVAPTGFEPVYQA